MDECKPLVVGVERRLGGVERKLDEIKDQLSAHARMTRELLGKEHELPTYVVLIPKAKGPGGTGKKCTGARAAAAAAAVRGLIQDPSGIFNDALVVHFVDPVSMKFARSNGGAGFELAVPKVRPG